MDIDIITYCYWVLAVFGAWGIICITSWAIQSIYKFIQDDSSYIENAVLKFVMLNIGYSYVGFGKYKHPQNSATYYVGEAFMYIVTAICCIGVGLYFALALPMLTLAIISIILIIFGARFVVRIGKKVDKLENR